MYTLQVTADKLNIRNTPDADPLYANWVGDLNKGEEFHATGLVSGKMYEGSDLWYVDNYKRYISSTAASINAQDYIDSRFVNGKLIDSISYNLLLNLNAVLKPNKGDGVAIAILDHAVRKDIKLQNEIVRPFTIDRPAMNHGSFIAGIIAGINGILGVAPNVTIIELPIYTKEGNLQTGKNLDDIFEFIESYPQPIILNVSQDLPGEFTNRFSNLKNAVIVASGGTDEELQGQLFLPAKLTNVISVGSVTDDFRNQHPDVKFNDRLDFIFPAFKYASFGSNAGQISLSTDTSSYATAIVSSLIALIYSQKKISDSVSEIRNKISALAQDYTQTNFSCLNVVNPKR